ncbi:MAG: ATP-dependent helicase [Snowella sp.]|nr:ATP-dependent helicase [Snowella sp.]
MNLASHPISSTLQEQLTLLRHRLRDGQRCLADWQGGEMAVSAVPGAGKSHSLSVAAAIAIANHQLQANRQLLIVTYTRSAAAAIKAKIKARLKELQLPAVGFMVQTLHGLALNIASRHPEASGLNLDNQTLLTPNINHRILRDAVEQWIRANPITYQLLLEAQPFDGEETEKLRRQSVLRTEVLPNLTHIVVREAKSSGLSPQDVRDLSLLSTDSYPILAIAAGLYEQYEKLMKGRNLIDYDDMILGALTVLEDPYICQQWQQQIFGVFEDEAQDSSPLQERLIAKLAINSNHPEKIPNLIRVGDPNQAINSTFTPADPVYFNWFCERCESLGNFATMDQAGRSNSRIMDAANFTLHWVNHTWEKPEESPQFNPQLSPQKKTLREKVETPFRSQSIRPVDPTDPQANANPEAEGKGLELYTPETIFITVDLIRDRVVHLLTQNPDHNAAILVRENRQARFLAELLTDPLKAYNLKVYEVGEQERFSKIPEEILKLLQFIDRPHSPEYLKNALEILQERGLIPAQDLNLLATYPEQFLYPSPLEPEAKPPVIIARNYCSNLLRARIELPHYQLIIFLGMTLKYTGSELATLHKLSERIEQQISYQSSLKATLNALQELVTSERFEGVEEESDEMYTKAGQLTLITMHKAKGLDWDYVFIPFLHQDVLPGQLWVPVSAKFLGDFTFGEVARAQIRTAIHYRYIHGQSIPEIPPAIAAWEEAEKLKKAEEYRLLYVAMTRAKRLLWMSAAHNGPFRWSTFQPNQRGNLQKKMPCPVITALKHQFPQSFVQSN